MTTSSFSEHAPQPKHESQAQDEGPDHGPDVTRILTAAAQQGASDVHFTVGLPVQIRLQGRWKGLDETRLTSDDCEFVGRILAGVPEIWARFVDALELDTSYSIAGVGRFRVNLFFQRGSVGAACRALPMGIPYFGELGLPEEHMEAISALRHGLVLVCGSTGSGKTTTLAAVVGHINRTSKRHIVTIEDPIEYMHRHDQSIVDQREVGLDTQSFANAMRHVLRQSPDVVLVGEIRDQESVRTALMLAETGHLVLSTIHSGEAVQALSRLVDMFPADRQEEVKMSLAAVLQTVLVQQLIPSINQVDHQVLAWELLSANAAVRNSVRTGRFEQVYSQMQTMRNEGMSTMNSSLLKLFRQEHISRDTALARSPKPREMLQLLDGAQG